MKKIIIALSSALFLLVFIFACTNTEKESVEKPQDQAQTEAFNSLNNSIDELNLSYPASTDTRARGRFWRFLKKLVVGDGLGGLIGCRGGLIGFITGGVIGSLLISVIPDEQMKPDPKSVRTLTEEVSVYDAADTLGLRHNEIICDIFDEYGNTLATMSERELATVVIEKVSQYYDMTSDAPSIDDVLLMGQKTLPIALAIDEDAEEGFKLLEQELVGHENEVQVVKKYYNKLTELAGQEEIIDYSNQFNQIVDESSIPEESKVAIGGVVSIATNSSILWSDSDLTRE